LIQVLTHGLQQVGDGLVDAHRHAAVNLLALGAEEMPERLAPCPQLRIQDRHLDRGLGHVVPMHGTQHGCHAGRREVAGRKQPRQQVVDKHLLRAVYVFGRVRRLLSGDALAPSFAIRRGRLQEQDVPGRLHAE
jgi:hypothetical protein